MISGRRLHIVRLRIQSLLGSARAEQELDEELRYHLEMRTEEYVARGMSREEARRSALIALGGLDRNKEECRDARGLQWLSEMLRGFRIAFRRLARSPLLSAVVVLSLALGIGANTGIFSMVHQILLRPLPVEKPEELALVTTSGAAALKKSHGSSLTDESGDSLDYVFSYPGFRQLESRSPAIADLAGFKYAPCSLSLRSEVMKATMLMVSGGYFPLMKVRPVMGRTVLPEDDRGAGNPVAMVGYRFWKNRLGGRTDILNHSIRISGRVFTIVGVAPKGFYGTTIGYMPDVFVPMATMVSPTEASQNGVASASPIGYWIYLIARIRPGATREQAEAHYAGAYGAIVEQAIKTGKVRRIAPRPRDLEQFRNSRIRFTDGSRGSSSLRTVIGKGASILMAATGLVLLIALANAANLLLARSAARKKELSICAAIGAGRGRIVGSLLAEALTLSLLGGALSFPFSMVVLNLLNRLSEPAGVHTDTLSLQLEWPVLLYCLGLSLVTGLLFGLYPAIQAARTQPMMALNQESGRSSEGLGAGRVRKSLVCAQVMISAILLVPTALLLRSVVNLSSVDLGMQTENLVSFSLSASENGYSSTQSRALHEKLRRELASLPGVSDLTFATCPLINDMQLTAELTIDKNVDREPLRMPFNAVGTGFFRKMGIPLLRGREFTDFDGTSAPRVAIVNERFARTYFAGQNPVGRTIHFGRRTTGPFPVGAAPGPIEIVGVAENSSFFSVDRKPTALFYIPCLQHTEFAGMTYYLRSAAPLAQTIQRVRAALHELDSNLSINDLRTMEEQVSLNTMGARSLAKVAAVAAAIATSLAMMGLYGVMLYSVIRRTREIGIRMAIGARPAEIRSMVVREMLLILSMGLILGIPLALAASQQIENLFFDVKSSDPLALAVAACALGLAACAAACLPAWRASRIDPLDALRCD